MSSPVFPPSTIVITGASSGIGAALANAYAAPGVTLGLLGRDASRLEEAAARCAAKGAAAEIAVIDVCDASAMQTWLAGFHARHPIDLLIANAGISAGSGGASESASQVRRIFAVNVDGLLNSVLPVLPAMQARKRGQIALVSSVAGLRGLPSCPAYSASKAAVRTLGEGWRGVLAKDGVRVSVVCPGYVKTPMTDVNTFPMPFLMTPERAASIIRRGLAKNRSRIAFPRRLYWPLWWLTCLSNTLTDPLFARLPGKAAMENT